MAWGCWVTKNTCSHFIWFSTLTPKRVPDNHNALHSSWLSELLSELRPPYVSSTSVVVVIRIILVISVFFISLNVDNTFACKFKEPATQIVYALPHDLLRTRLSMGFSERRAA